MNPAFLSDLNSCNFPLRQLLSCIFADTETDAASIQTSNAGKKNWFLVNFNSSKPWPTEISP
jgi:hypothetical protein